MAHPALAPAIAGLLTGWIREQPWFVMPPGRMLGVEITELEQILDVPETYWVELNALFGTAGTSALRLLLTVRPGDFEVPEALAGCVVGVTDVGAERVLVHETLGLADSATLAAGALFGRSDWVAAAPMAWGMTSSGAVLADRSGERTEIKAYRRGDVIASPDIEIPAALHRTLTGCVAPVSGSLNRHGHIAVTARPALGSTHDAISTMVESVAEVFRLRKAPSECPLDVAGELEQIGRVIGEFHVAMADAFGVTSADDGSWIDTSVASLRGRAGSRVNVRRLQAVFERLRVASDLGSAIRLHQHLHLGNVVRTPSGWTVANFEGDGRPFTDLYRSGSPLVDVARVLSSVELCARSVLVSELTDDDERDRELAVLMESWEQRAADALISGYTSVPAVHRLLPPTRDGRDALLAVFELAHQLEAAIPGPEDSPWIGGYSGRGTSVR